VSRSLTAGRRAGSRTWALGPALLVGLALGLTTVSVVRGEPGFALAQPGASGLVVLLLPGWSLMLVGLVAWLRREETVPAVWFAVAGTSWFVAEWNNPTIGSDTGFTAGLVCYALTSGLLLPGVLSYPSGRATRVERVVLVAGWALTAVVIGLLPALLADPADDGCRQCPRDLLAIADRPGLATDVTRTGVALGAAWAVVAAALVVRRALVAGTALRRARAGVSAAVAAYLVLAAVSALHLLASESLNIDGDVRRLHAAQAVALVALAGAVAWGWTRRRRTRRRLARLVLDLAQTPPPGGLRDSLAVSLGDGSLRLGYRLADGRLVDVAGRPVELDGPSTPLVRAGRTVALLTHRAGLLDDPRIAEEVTSAARLALENEQLQAELAAQLAHLRSSRQRVIATADATRRRLERDLHDGAQQQLVGLLLRLRLDRAGWASSTDAVTRDRAAEVERELEAAVEELRDLARGIFPSVLAEEGLAAAVEDLAEDAAIPVTVIAVPEQRLPSAVESAGYFVVSEAVRGKAARQAVVCVALEEDKLRVGVDLVGALDAGDWFTSFEDRVGALDGDVVVEASPGGLRVEAVIPCAS
jgi:signal transduction histidine kinase